MPIEEPNFLTPTAVPGEERLDELKRWLSKSTDITLSTTPTDLVMAVKAAADHISMDLHVHAHVLIESAQAGVQPLI